MGTATLDFFFGHWSGGDAGPVPGRYPNARPPAPGAALSPADASLAERLRNGDSSALESLFRTHAADLEQYARRLLHSEDAARDVVQDVFVWLWETRAEFAPRASVRGYLFGAVRHRATDARRRDGVRERYSAGVADVTGVETPEELLEHAELRDVVAAALAGLTPRVREVAELRWLGQLSYREIASLLGVSERTVNTQLVTATRHVRARLERYWQER